MWMRDAARKEKLPTIAQLDSARYFPYRYGQALWAYLAGRFGDQVVGQGPAGDRGPQSNDAETILKAVLGVDDEDALQGLARRAARGRRAADRRPQGSGPAVRPPPLVTEDKAGRRAQRRARAQPRRLAAGLPVRARPVLDRAVRGRRAAPATSRGGCRARPWIPTWRACSSSTPPARGTATASGSRWARSARAARCSSSWTRAAGERVREVPFPTLGEIHDPELLAGRQAGRVLRPGRRVQRPLRLRPRSRSAAAADQRRLRRPAAGLVAGRDAGSPSSPIASRPTSRRSHTGNYRLALLDVASGDIRALPAFTGAKNINPQWTRSRRRPLLPVRRQRRHQRLPAWTIADGALFQLTDLITGVSGITALSPALTVAARADRLAFSVYESEKLRDLRHRGRRAPGRLARHDGGGPERGPDPGREGRRRGPRRAGRIPRAAWPTRPTSRRSPTRPSSASTTSASPPSGPASGRTAASFGGGVAMSFSDMLGEHSLQHDPPGRQRGRLHRRRRPRSRT